MSTYLGKLKDTGSRNVDMNVTRYYGGAKKAEAEKAIEENKALRDTIMKDMREVAGMAISQPVFDFAALLTIGKKELIGGD